MPKKDDKNNTEEQIIGRLLDRYARSRLRNALVRVAFVCLAAAIMASAAGLALASACFALVLAAEWLDLLANRNWLRGRYQTPSPLIFTAISHALASSLSAVVTWQAGGEEFRFIVAMLCGGALLNAGLTLSLFRNASLARIIIYVSTISALYITDAVRLVFSQTTMSLTTYYADLFAGFLCFFITFAYLNFIYSYQVRKFENEQTIAKQNASLTAEVAERAHRMEQLEDAKMKAERAIEAKSAILAAVSHEIRTPLNGIIGIAELLKETKLDSIQLEYAETINRSGAALLSIVNDILDFSKLDADKARLNLSDFNIHQTIEEVTMLLSSKMSAGDVDLIVDLDFSLPQLITSDDHKFRQILSNLIGNAVKFTQRGYVLVKLGGASQGPGHFLFQLSVKDTGIGIPSDEISKIFEEFQQAESSKTLRTEGTGLGLAITQRLVHLMGGHITVSSEIGVGSCFEVSLPVSLAEVSPGNNVTISPDLSGKTCLIVDPVEPSRQMLLHKMTRWGAECKTAANVEEALNLYEAQKSQLDLLLVDQRAHKTSETCLISHIHKTTPFLPVLELTCEHRAISMSLENVKYLAKPATERKLSAVVSKLLHPVIDSNLSHNNIDPHQEPTRRLPTDLRILIADDNLTNRLIIKYILKDQPVSLVFAETGTQAVSIYKTFVPDIVLMDLSMPELDGFQATQMIRAYERAENMTMSQVVALTAASNNAEQHEKCLAIGMDHFLTKPITRTALFDHLIMLVSNKNE